jgi:glucose dehydrogenase
LQFRTQTTMARLVCYRVLACVVLATGIMLAQAPSPRSGSEWQFYGRDPGGMRFSPLEQINVRNVQRLQRAWTYNVPTTASSWIESFESTPLMVNDVLYFATQTGVAIAVDAETGKQLWIFNPYGSSQGDVRPVPNRGVAYWAGRSPISCDGARNSWDKRIFYVTPEARLFALDAMTGKACDGFGEAGAINLRQGVASGWPAALYDVTSPPATYRDLIIVGSEVQEYPSRGPSGAVRAFNVRTGKLVWTFDAVPKSGEVGHDTWPANGWKGRSGTNAWGPISVDVKHGLVFLPISSPSYDFYGADRKGKDVFSDSLVAVDARTGKLIWYYQLVHHDLWDIDLPAQPTLVTLHRAGRNIPAVVVVGKTGFVFVFNRLTGKPLFPIVERPVPQSHLPGEATWPTQPFPVKPPPLALTFVSRNDLTTVIPESRRYCLEHFGSILPARIFDPWGLTLSLEIPGTLGGTNWGGPSFDPSSGYLFVNVSNLGTVGQMDRQPAGSPEAYVWGSKWGSYTRYWDNNRYPCQQPPWGTMSAVNLNTGRVVWQVPLGVVDALEEKGIPQTGIYNLGGSIASAGGLVFIGATADRRLRAFDARTGKELWVTKLEANGYATPMTYLGGRTKRQFIVIAVGPSDRFSTGASAPTVLAAYALFPKGHLSSAQARLQPELRLPVQLGNVPGGPGSLPPTLTPPLPAPVQPIPFSHKVHISAGMQCASCHQLSKNADEMEIPKATLCLVCHRTIASGSPAIRQLTRWSRGGVEIPWVRVYKLPSYVLFSHKTHIDAKVSCEVCHGAVRDEVALRQDKDVSMVSCANCHRLRSAPVSCHTCHNLGR